MRKDSPNKDTELAVIFKREVHFCCLDFISWKVVCDNHFGVKRDKEFDNLCPNQESPVQKFALLTMKILFAAVDVVSSIGGLFGP